MQKKNDKGSERWQVCDGMTCGWRLLYTSMRNLITRVTYCHVMSCHVRLSILWDQVQWLGPGAPDSQVHLKVWTLSIHCHHPRVWHLSYNWTHNKSWYVSVLYNDEPTVNSIL